VAEIAALVVGVGVGRELDRVELEAGVVGLGANCTSSNTKNSASGPKKTVSPTPIDLTIASAFLAMPRGSRL
jgi:hypothetical protein